MALLPVFLLVGIGVFYQGAAAIGTPATLI
jgi:hypothetical protein